MKFSVYLILLPFTLSAPSLYELSFPSFVYVPKSKSYNPTFVIREYGMFIWKVHEVEDETHDTASSTSEHSERDYKNKLANKLSIKWPAKIESVNFTVSDWNLINLELNTSETYILLKVNPNNEYFGFYWMGNESGLIKRTITARLVVRMMHDLSQQMKQRKLVHISREEENKESAEFQSFFNKIKSKPLPKLFRVTGNEEEKLIMEAPLHYNELNSTDAFLLDTTKIIFIWYGYSTNSFRETALALAKYIQKTERHGKDVAITSADFTDIGKTKKLNSYRCKFRKALDGSPKPFRFPVVPSSDSSEKLRLKREEQLRLYEYSIIHDWVISKEISIRPLEPAHFQIDKAHILTDSYSGNIFIHIGSNVHNAVIEQAMAAAEIIYWDVPKYRWQNVA